MYHSHLISCVSRMTLDDTGTPPPHGQNIFINFIPNPCGVFLHSSTRIYFSYCEFLDTTRCFLHTPVFKRIPEMTNNANFLGINTSYFSVLLGNLLASSWCWGYGIWAGYDTFLRRRCDTIEFFNRVAVLRLFIFESY